MTLNLDIIGRAVVDDEPWEWAARDTLLYALGVGAGMDGDRELALTTDSSRGVAQQVLPTFAVVMGMGRSEIGMGEFGDFPMTRVLHAGQRVVSHAAIPATGAVTCTRNVTRILDKGKNALIETTAGFRDASSGELLVESTSQIMVRGEGGFGGDAGPKDAWAAPERPADRTVSQQTHPNQALLYRLSGDTNPLHSDPSFAADAGFPRPILHGLCTYGFAARAVLETVADGDTERFGSFGARFSSPVFPGELLQTRIWRTETGAVFQTLAGERIVLDRGEFSLR
ncbi:MAG: MaoC/PaaZ C-terminal domain-containing protein [Agromyces sp.]